MLSCHRRCRSQVRLVRGVPKDLEADASVRDFQPDEVWVTSLFTYWLDHVSRTVAAYRDLLPRADIAVGGICASLLGESSMRERTRCDRVHVGLYPGAETVVPAYDLLGPNQVDYQILHASRGCRRRCSFCGTWRIERDIWHAQSVGGLVDSKKIVFYDNNFLDNPHIEEVLHELATLRAKQALTWCESQSGFDGRILAANPHLALLLRQAGFRYPRIAWDDGFRSRDSILEQIRILESVGYKPRSDIYVFMLYNWDIPFAEMEAKRVACWDWKVQIADCRYRPLDQLHDHYSPFHEQDGTDYHIHRTSGWTDRQVKQFRRNVREQNICVRHGLKAYSRAMERGKGRVSDFGQAMTETARGVESLALDFWDPGQTRSVDGMG